MYHAIYLNIIQLYSNYISTYIYLFDTHLSLPGNTNYHINKYK